MNWGYGWVFLHEDELLVGVGGLKPVNPNIRESLMKYGDVLGINLRDAPVKGHPLPFGNYVRRPYHRNVLLLGDAGGFVDPLTGEGIFYAHRTGELAARAEPRPPGDERFLAASPLGLWQTGDLRRPLISFLSNGASPEKVMEIATATASGTTCERPVFGCTTRSAFNNPGTAFRFVSESLTRRSPESSILISRPLPSR